MRPIVVMLVGGMILLVVYAALAFRMGLAAPEDVRFLKDLWQRFRAGLGNTG
jgi:hypothetical protein